MKVCIYGAGAIGGWIGVHLAQTGHQISVVARGETLQALQKNGLQCIQTQDPEKILVPKSAHLPTPPI
jgi:2-dehydropantoate 2-reductase